jgi:hypothetical protein
MFDTCLPMIMPKKNKSAPQQPLNKKGRHLAEFYQAGQIGQSPYPLFDNDSGL